MKRLAVVMAILGLAGCSKGEEKPASPAMQATPAPADTTHGMMMMGDSAKMKMGDTSKHMMMMPDTSKKKK